MENFVNTLLWVGMIAGGLMVILLLLSILGGLDLDGDADVDSGSEDGAGGLGVLKSILTFISVGSFTVRAVVLNSEWSWSIAIISGIIGGVISVFILSMLLKFLLKQQEEGNYEFWEAEGKEGRVYVPIPEDGTGKITIEINGVNRELPAKSQTGMAIGSNKRVLVLESSESFLVVTEID